MPSWNDKDNNKTNIFYVGKSNKIGQRIKEHTCKASKSTYALKLNEMDKKTRSQLKYKIHIFYLESDSENKRNAVNELIEPILHKKLEPSIGSSRQTNKVYNY